MLKKFFYKPILDLLNKREADIKRGIVNTEESQKLLTKTEEKEKQILKNAQKKAEDLITHAKMQSDEIRKNAESLALKEGEKIVQQARLKIEEESRIAEEKLTENIGKIALTLLEKSLKGIFDEREQKIIMKKAINSLRKEI